MDQIDSFMLWFNLIIGVYISYVAITGKGKPYENDYPKQIKEDIYKLNRLMYSVAGPVLVISGVLELLKVPFAAWISIILVLLLIIGYLIIFFTRYGKIIKEDRKRKF
jgi:predicted permease